MKKVLSAVVLSAAVVATAGQAHAYGDFNIAINGVRGTLMGIMYTDNTEIYINLGDFQTENNQVVFDHQFSETGKLLQTVDYKSILQSRGDTGAVHMSFVIHDMIGASTQPRHWDAYYATTTPDHGGEVPDDRVTFATTGANSLNPFKRFNTFTTNAYNGANLLGSDDILVMEVDNEYSWHLNAINDAEYSHAEGSYADMNRVSADWGYADLSAYAGQCEIDMTLWQVRHETLGTSVTTDDYNQSLGIAATIRFNKETGAITLNASGEPASCVPVPAAAWLLGSGVLGLFGLRRRNA